jgi:hypothetical protein
MEGRKMLRLTSVRKSGQECTSRRPRCGHRSTQRVLARAAHVAHLPLHTRGRATKQPAERTSLCCQLGPPAAKTDLQKTATLQRPCLCDGSHIGWLSPTRSLWLYAPTHRRASEHACPPCRSSRPARSAVACLCPAATRLHPAACPCYAAGLRLLALLRPAALVLPVVTACVS